MENTTAIETVSTKSVSVIDMIKEKISTAPNVVTFDVTTLKPILLGLADFITTSDLELGKYSNALETAGEEIAAAVPKTAANRFEAVFTAISERPESNAFLKAFLINVGQVADVITKIIDEAKKSVIVS